MPCHELYTISIWMKGNKSRKMKLCREKKTSSFHFAWCSVVQIQYCARASDEMKKKKQIVYFQISI